MSPPSGGGDPSSKTHGIGDEVKLTGCGRTGADLATGGLDDFGRAAGALRSAMKAAHGRDPPSSSVPSSMSTNEDWLSTE